MMRLVTTSPAARMGLGAIIVILSMSASSVTAWVGPGARALTIQECLQMISTESDTEMGFDESNSQLADFASRLWKDANSFEWLKAETAESNNNHKYPYLLCHVGKDPITGKNLSGFQRKQRLAEAIDYVPGEDYFRPLYNSDDYLCGYGQLLASRAAGITGEDFIVQPVVPSLKYMKGSVDKMQEDIAFHNLLENGDNNPELDIVLCPGVAVAINDDNEEDETSSTKISEWEDVPQEMAADIINQLLPKTIASQLAAAIGTTLDITDTYYLTSDQYMNATAEAGTEPTDRSKLWMSLIEDYQQSGKCDESYSSRLKWTIQRAENPETDVSLLHVSFNTTGNTEEDVGCMLTLSLAIAAHPDVCSLESRERVSTNNAVITWLTQSELEGKRPFFDVGLDGTGQVVAVSDTGVDQDSCYFADPNVVANADSVNTNARKLVQYIPFVDSADYQYGHGTHVAGTVAGKRIDGTGMADGVAPGAKIAFADIGDRNGGLALPLDSRLLKTGRPNAKIHSASWGSELNFYTTQARNFDQYMYDNDDFLIVVAAGNSGNGDAPNTVGSPATAKNVIAVGAHHNTGSSKPDRGLGPSYVADFSSRGPTSDGRTKPDMMAPGKAVLSAGALPGVVGECDPGKVPDANGRSDGVLSLQGTSMATPVVSGTAAIIRQYFEQGYYPTGVEGDNDAVNPTGGLVKAVLMNGAQFLAGVDNGINGVTNILPYDNNQNFGRLALQYSLYLPGKTDVQMSAYDKRVVFDQDSWSPEKPLTIDKSDGCTHPNLSVTLVWVEPGSTPGCVSCVLNDLDLTVEMGGKTYYPNNKGRADRHNNAERVIINDVKNGDEATITVTGYNLIQNYQQFSLVATGCFGGVANLNFIDQCSEFECDDSESKRTQNILMAIFIPLGVLLLCGCGAFFLKRKRAQGDTYDEQGPDNNVEEL